MEDLEVIYEAIETEIEKLEEETTKTRFDKTAIITATKNLNNINNKIYCLFENCVDEKYTQEVEQENKMLKQLLFEIAQNDLQLLYDLKYRYNIEQ